MKTGKQLIQFLEASPTCFQTVDTIRRQLESFGYHELRESEAWQLESGERCYVVRNQSSLIAFDVPEGMISGFQIGAAHSDSPGFRVKPEMELTSDHYVKINTEPYGGAIYSTWMDRPLSVAGRVMVESGGRVESRLVKVDRDLLLIPQVAIHMNRKVNEGYAYNAQTDMMPLFSGGQKGFREIIAEEAQCEPEDILGMDLFLYNRTEGMLWGGREEFISAPRLDDLQCAYALLEGFLESNPGCSMPVYAVFDNEEVGSLTRQGADSTFLEDTLRRVSRALGLDESEYLQLLASSFLVSADNAHAVHPNHPEFSDSLNRVWINKGPAIKFNGNQKYTSDSLSEALFRQICRRAGVTCQTYTNRSDMAGGSTLGNLSNRHVSLKAVDIGLPQLSMHSCYETAGTLDTEMLIRVMEEFYSVSLEDMGGEIYSWR